MKNRNIYCIKQLKTILFIATFLLLLLLISNLYNNKLYMIDELIYPYISVTICPPLTMFFKIITKFADIFLILLILILVFLKNKKHAFYLAFNSVAILMINIVLKNIFRRIRPVGINLIEENGYSFPSGHSMISVVFYGFIMYLIWKSKLSINLKKTFCLLLYSFILLIGISRIYLGVHYFTDVITGFCISLLYLLIFIKIIETKKSSKML